MLLFLSSSSLIALSWMGWGTLIHRTSKIEPNDLPMQVAIMGMALTACLAMAWHLFFPVTSGLALTWMALGITSWVVLSKDKLKFLGWFCFWLVLGVCVFRAAPENFDAGLYYVPTLKWWQTERVTLGVVNIHGRLAFNSLWHNLAAMGQVPWHPWAGAFSLNAALWSLFLTDICLRGWQRLPATSWRFWMGVVLLTLPGMSEGYRWSSPAHDLPCAILGLHVLASSLEAPRSSHLLATLVAALSKMLALPLLLLSLLRPQKIPAVVLTATLLGLWLLRSWLLSGCLVYPAAFTCVSATTWTPGQEAVERAAQFVHDRALYPLGAQEGGWKVWGKQFFTSALGIYFLACLLLSPGLWRYRKLLWRQVLTVALLALAWLLGGPYPRMGYLAIAALCSLSLWVLFRRSWFERFTSEAVLAAALAVWLIQAPWRNVLAPQVWPKFASPEKVIERSQQGLEYYRPDGHIKCWDLPLPCVTHFNPAIEKKQLGLWYVYFVRNRP